MDPNTQNYWTDWGAGKTPLSYPSGHSGSDQVTVCLLGHDANKDLRNEALAAPFFGAVETSTTTTEILEREHADSNTISSNGNTVLRAAAWFASQNPLLEENAATLFKRGADKFARNSDGFTPVDYVSFNSSLTRLFFETIPLNEIRTRL